MTDETSRGCCRSGAGFNELSSYPCSPLLHVEGAGEVPGPRVADAAADEVPARHVEAADEVPASHAEDGTPAGEVVRRRGETFVRDGVWRRFPRGARAARWL